MAINVSDETTACEACGREPGECEVPMGEGAAQACWRCAHAIVEHDATLATAAELGLRCRCSPEDIYPAQARGAAGEAN